MKKFVKLAQRFNMTIAINLAKLNDQIAELTTRYHRAPGSVQLLAVSKNQASATIEEAYAAGQRAFGENYLQEALSKMSDLKNLAIEWHFIGAIQSNKTKKIAEHFDWVHTIADLTVAERLNKQRPDELPPLNICLQVNISHEPGKAGCHPENILMLANACKKFTRLNLRGIMTIPAQNISFAAQRAEFHKMYELFQKLLVNDLKLDTLSMGMSDDLEAAIAEGSTMLRIGTKIFGIRF